MTTRFRLAGALAASIALHGLALLGFADRVPDHQVASSSTPALKAVMTSPQPGRAVGGLVEPRPVLDTPRRLLAAHPADEVRAPRRVRGADEPKVRREPAESAAVPARVPADPGQESPPAVMARPQDSVIESLGSRDSADGEDLRQYRMAIAIQAKRFRRYPALARERGWQGTAEVSVKIVPDRPLPTIVLEKSSGFVLLDEQALDLLRHASVEIPIPEGLRRKGARFALPVEFSLEH